MFDKMLEFSLNHPLLVGSFFIVAIVLIIYETKKGNNSINCQDAVFAVNRNLAVFVDIRNVASFVAGHIASSINIPTETLDAKFKTKTFEKYKQKQIILVCNTGAEAGTLVQKFKSAGYENTVKLKGGLANWRDENLPLVKGKA